MKDWAAAELAVIGLFIASLVLFPDPLVFLFGRTLTTAGIAVLFVVWVAAVVKCGWRARSR